MSAEALRDALVSSHLSAIEKCMKRIDGHIVAGELSGDGTDKTAQRNGLILAYNLLVDLYEHETPNS